MSSRYERVLKTFVVAVVFSLVAFSRAAPALADFIGLGTQQSSPEFEFIGTGTNVIDLLLENCSGGVCTMASVSAFGTGVFAFTGTYLFSSSSSSPFSLACLGAGDFAVTQTSPINFSYTTDNPLGNTLTGTVNFTHASDLAGNFNTLSGILTVNGGNLAGGFPSGFGSVELRLSSGFPLQSLCGATGAINSEIEYEGTITPTPISTGACPLTQGFWKNHPDAWPVSSLTIGGVTLTETQLITILQTAPKKGDARLILEHQLIAALLNVANGSIPDATVQSAITDSQTLLTGNLNTYVAASSTLGQQMIGDAAILDAFNNGAFSVGCSSN